jgi:hypothetical protein
MVSKVNDDYKFRITCKTNAQAVHKPNEFEFRYLHLSEARKNYKAILLGLYRKKNVTEFSICLNRCRDRQWTHAIHKETVQRF